MYDEDWNMEDEFWIYDVYLNIVAANLFFMDSILRLIEDLNSASNMA